METFKQKGRLGDADLSYAMHLLGHVSDMARNSYDSVQMLENVRQNHCIDVEL